MSDHKHHHDAPANPYHESDRTEEHNQAMTERVAKIESLLLEKGIVDSDALEKLIDELNEEVGPLLNFVLPGGTVGAAALQVARTVCRRAERVCVTLNREENVNPPSMAYLNRLSDALFVMGRFENKEAGVEEALWDSKA